MTKYILFSALIFLISACDERSTSSIQSIDSTPPEITLFGNNKITLSQDDEYTELGATAIDREDGNINVAISGYLSTHIPGMYTLQYSAIDYAGNKTSTYRDIEILKTTQYSKPSYLNQHKVSIIPKQMETLELKIISSTHSLLKKNIYLRANNIFLSIEKGTILLHNHSYKKIKSLIGKYIDDSNQSHLIKLNFNSLIYPQTDTQIKSFSNAHTMSIYHTSGMLNQAINYTEEVCNPDIDNEETVKYCKPLLKEQKIYEQNIATLHKFYNNKNALTSWINYVKNISHNNVILSNKEIIHSFMKATLPNNLLTLKSSHYIHNNDGVGAGERMSLIGTKQNRGWSSLWYEHLVPLEQSILTFENKIALFHHEMMHGRGFNHQSGMTYGFSNYIGSLLNDVEDTYYPITEVPKYIFDIKYKEANKMLVTMYSTSSLPSNSFTAEILSVHPISMKHLTSEDPHKFIIQTKNIPSIRFYLRVYAEDSQDVMSKLIYPYHFTSSLKKEIGRNTKLYIIPHQNWKIINKYNNEKISMHPQYSKDLCIAWTGNMNAKNENITNIETLDDIEEPLLVGDGNNYKHYYLYTSQQTTPINYDSVIHNTNVDILCTLP